QPAVHRRQLVGDANRILPMTLFKMLVLAVSVCLAASFAGAAPSSYDQLVTFFKEWRAFQKPKLVDGVPDYSAAAMGAQQRALEDMKRRLAAIDPSGWPIPQQVDYQVVRAELAGLDFDHRVLKPWANNPGFYVTVFNEESDQPAREGPFAFGAVELWTYKFPLSAADAEAIRPNLRAIPALLAQAKVNLTGGDKDLWTYGAKDIRAQSEELARLAPKLTGAGAALAADVAAARKATDDFAAWVESKAASRTGPSGIGVENYDWYLKNVQLVPYTW